MRPSTQPHDDAYPHIATGEGFEGTPVSPPEPRRWRIRVLEPLLHRRGHDLPSEHEGVPV